MEIATLEVEKEEIDKELSDLRKSIKAGYLSKRNKLTRDLMAVYGHLQHGGKIIDVYSVFGDLGLKDDLPKMAIVPNGSPRCYLYKKKNGSAILSRENKEQFWQSDAKAKYMLGDVLFPPDTFEWEDLEKNRFKCTVPIIPPRINAQISERILPYHYHILFEPSEWTESKPPPAKRDPILCKRLTPNLFGVIATWDLTDLEHTILKGYAK